MTIDDIIEEARSLRGVVALDNKMGWISTKTLIDFYGSMQSFYGVAPYTARGDQRQKLLIHIRFVDRYYLTSLLYQSGTPQTIPNNIYTIYNEKSHSEFERALTREWNIFKFQLGDYDLGVREVDISKKLFLDSERDAKSKLEELLKGE